MDHGSWLLVGTAGRVVHRVAVVDLRCCHHSHGCVHSGMFRVVVVSSTYRLEINMRKFMSRVAVAVGAVVLAVSMLPGTGHAAGPIGRCKELVTLPAYTYLVEGAEVFVPSGRVLWRELRSDGLRGARAQRACLRLVLEWREHNG